MNANIKIIGSNNDILKLGNEYRGELIANKLIVNSRIRHSQYDNVIICDQYIHVGTWFVDADSNGGRVEMELYWT